VLTKPLGSGVIFNANRAGKFSAALLEDLLPVVATLNGSALEKALKYEVHGLTDVTGFALGGHGLEMAIHSEVRMVLDFTSLPLYEGALDMYAAGVTTGSNEGNRRLCGGRLEIRTTLRRGQEEIIFDPQTSGGLLISLPEGQAADLVRDLHEAGVPWAAVIGNVKEGVPGITVT
jgi:selenide,water dikinase